MDVAIVERVSRPTGQPPRCRQCGRVVHANQAGPAIDRFCPAHCGSETRTPLPLIAWAAGAAFSVGSWRTGNGERSGAR